MQVTVKRPAVSLRFDSTVFPQSNNSLLNHMLNEVHACVHVCVCAFMCSVASVTSDSLRPYGLTHQLPLSMRFFRQEYWSGLPCPPLGHLPDPEVEPESPVSPALQADSLTTEPPEKPVK